MSAEPDPVVKVTHGAKVPQEPKPRPRVRVLSPRKTASPASIIALVLLCAAIAGLCLLYRGKLNVSRLYMAAGCLGASLAVWLAFCGLAARSWSTGGRFLALAAIVLSFAAGNVPGLWRDRDVVRSAMSAAAPDVLEVVQSRKAASDGATTPPERMLDQKPKASGAAGQVEQLLRLTMNRFTTMGKAYRDDLDTIGWERFLIPNRLANDSNFVESRTMVEKTRGFVAKYRARTFAIVRDLRSSLQNINIDERTRSELLRDYDDSIDKARRLINELWDTEVQMINECDGIIALLEARKGKWAASNGVLVFDDSNDAKAFDARLQAIATIAQKQDDTEKTRTDALEQSLKELVK